MPASFFMNVEIVKQFSNQKKATVVYFAVMVACCVHQNRIKKIAAKNDIHVTRALFDSNLIFGCECQFSCFVENKALCTPLPSPLEIGGCKCLICKENIVYFNSLPDHPKAFNTKVLNAFFYEFFHCHTS